MNENILILIISFLSLLLLFVTFVYVVGIVWRVEMELDLSYKFFAVALFFLVFSEVFAMLHGTQETEWKIALLYTLKFFVSLNLFIGMYYMRDLIRKIDGEIRTGDNKEQRASENSSESL